MRAFPHHKTGIEPRSFLLIAYTQPPNTHFHFDVKHAMSRKTYVYEIGIRAQSPKNYMTTYNVKMKEEEKKLKRKKQKQKQKHHQYI